MLLALDVSTKIIGYSIWNKQNQILIELNYYQFKEEEDLIQKALEFKNLLQTLKATHTIKDMVIEKSYLTYSTSDARTIARLNQINILIQYICYTENININSVDANKVRRIAFPKYVFRQKKRAGGLGYKEQAFTLVLAELGEDMFPKKIMSKGKNKGEERFESYCLDMSDSYVIGRGFLKMVK